MKISRVIILFLSIVSLGCGNLFPEKVGYDELSNWISKESNGYIENVSVGDITYQCVYLPYQFYAVNELLKQGLQITKDHYDSVVGDYQQSVAFRVKVKIDDGRSNLFDFQCIDYQSKANRQFYLQNLLKNDFTLLIDSTELPCLEALCENHFNISPWTDINLIFDLKSIAYSELETSNISLKYSDKILGTSINIFKFPDSKRKSIPSIVF